MRPYSRSRALSLASLALLLSPAASAGGHVRLVGAGGVTAYTEIQAAVNAAQDGDLILVGSGQYAKVQISSKGVAIFATPGSVVDVDDRLHVLGLGPNQAVVVHGVRVGDLVKGPSPALTVQGCAGPVRLQDCEFFGVELWLSDFDCPLGNGVHGANLFSSDSVALLGCSVIGGKAEQYVQGMDCEPLDGGPALRAHSSRVVLHDTLLRGAAGVDSKGGGKGGMGLLAEGGAVLDSSGGDVIGGNGGWGSTSMAQDFGGLAGSLIGGTWRALDTFLAKGVKEPPGDTVAHDVNLTLLPGVPRTLDADVFGTPGTRSNVTIAGLAGDRVLPLAASAMGHQLVPATNQVWLGPWPVHQVQPALGTTLPAGGSASVPVHLPPLASGATHALLTVQAFVRPPHSNPFLSDARMLLALDPGLGPDCDGSGLGDLYEIALGLVPDTNHNLIPDTCPGG